MTTARPRAARRCCPPTCPPSEPGAGDTIAGASPVPARPAPRSPPPAPLPVLRSIIQSLSNHGSVSTKSFETPLRRLASVRREARGGDAGERAGFVPVRGVAADADRADNLPGIVSDQHAARRRDDAPARGGHQRLQKYRAAARRAPREFAPAEPHAERAPRLAGGDLRSQDA